MNNLNSNNVTFFVMSFIAYAGGCLMNFLRKPGILSILLVTFYFIWWVFIPRYYSWIAEAPKPEDINYISGNLVVKKWSKGEVQIGLKYNGTVEYFSCTDSMARGEYGCGVKRELLYEWGGKNAKIGWFWQPIHLFRSHRRLVWLSIDGEEKISVSGQARSIKIGRDIVPSSLVIDLILFSGWFWFSVWYMRKINK